MRLKDKVAVVTGGGNGIGRAICMTFADEGADVVVADIDAAAAKTVADEIIKHGGKAITTVMDVTNPVDVNKGVEKTMDAFGKMHLFGNYNCTKAFLPKIMGQGWGRIITMASIQAKQASPQNSSYTAAKHALVGMTRTVAHEVAMAGYPKITVNAICPGIVATDLVLGPGGALEQVAAQYNISKEQVIAMAKSKCLQNRLLEVDEIAGMAVFLASEDAKGITGQAINVCGGAVFH
jgi:NAD(P)-dependent dehydrogenase (short-subunit alcohol dehydrogenase family)